MFKSQVAFTTKGTHQVVRLVRLDDRARLHLTSLTFVYLNCCQEQKKMTPAHCIVLILSNVQTAP